MNRLDLAELRAQATRADYASMARLARALYADGLDAREVLRECYGVTFPDEVFAVVDAGLWALDLRANFTNQPWELAVPPTRGGPAERPDPLAEVEARLWERDPDLLPVLEVPGAGAGDADRVLCYRLTELRAGRPSVFALAEEPYPARGIAPGGAERCGDCLLDVVREEHARTLRALEEELNSPWNVGAGSLAADEVEDARATLEHIDRLRGTVDGQRDG
ncbi:hypothetical protein [Streptomyces sp. NPDC050504]|uniref:hypothetical protein n=1 Tax=Streptomyces sp. NPDC050504 TaxID=3365618 RepID=UPI0037B53935